ncbi:MAG: flagellar brake protein [Cellulosilyticaceae bacterium]
MSNTINRDTETITSSILMYQESIMRDINTKMRLKDDHDKCYLTTITKWENDTLIFPGPLAQRDWVLFALPTVLECCFVTRNAMYMTRIELFDRKRTEHELIYKARIVDIIEKKQQRAHFRLDVLVPIHYAVLTTPTGEKLETITKIKGTCVNISVGGMCMVCNERLDANQHLAVYLDFLDNQLLISGKILYKGQSNENGTYSHHVQFYGMDLQKENLLSRLIFEKQRMQMRQTATPLYQKKS